MSTYLHRYSWVSHTTDFMEVQEGVPPGLGHPKVGVRFKAPVANTRPIVE